MTDDGTFGHNSNPNPPELVALAQSIGCLVNLNVFALPFAHCFAFDFVTLTYISALAPLVVVGVLFALMVCRPTLVSEWRFWRWSFEFMNFVFPRVCNIGTAARR